MITRSMQALLPELGKGFPIISITGPRYWGRQAGIFRATKLESQIIPKRGVERFEPGTADD